MTAAEFWEGMREVIREEVKGEQEATSLITYKEIEEVYNYNRDTISRKVNAAKLIIKKAHYNGRLQNAISKVDAERLFRKASK